MKFDEYYMRNFFVEKSYTKCDGETYSRLFSKKSKLNISLNLKSEISYSFFLCPRQGNQGADHLLLPHIKLFQKQKLVSD